MRRLKVIFLCLAVAFLSVGITLSACDFGGSNGNGGNGTNLSEMETTASTNGLVFTLDKEGYSYSVTGFNKKSKKSTLANVLIPATYENLPVMGIADSAFREQNLIGRVEVEKSDANEMYFTVGESAFEGAFNLQEVDLPSGTRTIPNNCFSGCRLKAISFEQVQQIGDYAFSGNEELESVNLPYVLSIGERAFYDCKKLTTVAFGDSDVSMGYSVMLGDGAFYNCSSLTGIDLTYVRTIGNECFYYCKALKDITFSNWQENVNLTAFNYCDAIETLNYVTVDNVHTGIYVLENGCYIAMQTKTLIIGVASNSDGEVIIPDGVKIINEAAFENRKGVTSVSIPASVTAIKGRAFQNCENITAVTFDMDGDLEMIGWWAFAGLTKLKSITLPNRFQILEGSSFDGCVELEEFVINNTIRRIDSDTFDNCRKLLYVIYDGTEEEWNEKQYDLRMDYVFYDRDERHAMINQEEKTMPVQFAVQ